MIIIIPISVYLLRMFGFTYTILFLLFVDPNSVSSIHL